MKTKKDKLYLAKGEITVDIKNGKYEIIGAIYTNGKISIPNGKQLPFICLEDGDLDITGGLFEELSASTIPKIWYDIPDIVIDKKIKKIVVLGEVDTGKSFFSTFIANQLLERELKVGVIDTDTGQSDIGAPGTIGFGIFDRSYFSLSEVPINRQFFIGNHSPGGCFTTFLSGISRITKYAEKKTDVFILDTTGWVHGDGGRSIKRAKIDIIDPDLIILLQRDNELEHLVRHIEKDKILRLTVSKRASDTSQIIRKELRENISRSFFKNAKEKIFSFDSVKFDRCFLGSGNQENNDFLDVLYMEKLPGWEGDLIVFPDNIDKNHFSTILNKYPRAKWFRPQYLKNIYVGLTNSNGFALAVGIISGIDFTNKNVSILTSLNESEKDKVKFIQIGSLRYNYDGTEAGFVPPGTI